VLPSKVNDFDLEVHVKLNISVRMRLVLVKEMFFLSRKSFLFATYTVSSTNFVMFIFVPY
jgi:hypothetical protein